MVDHNVVQSLFQSSVGIVLKVLPRGRFSGDSNLADYFLLGGFGGVGLLLVIYMIQDLYNKRRRNKVVPLKESDSDRNRISRSSLVQEDENNESQFSPNLAIIRAKNRYAKKAFWKMTRNFLLALILIIVGSIASGAHIEWLKKEFYYYHNIEVATCFSL
ncbi:hypothetical protein BKA69DRAFT_1052062 [Paraphysoderma sedebokerense]|nr:hypothetical protein BKA69DRAFT_1052062 [Paraphysoderma sedebokerense]